MRENLSLWLSGAVLISSAAFVVWSMLGRPGVKRELAERSHIVTIANGIIHHQLPDGETESVPFASLRAVVIETNGLGPFSADVFWILVGDGTDGCYIPLGATGDSELLALLQTLPGFDSRKFMDAMASTSCRKFVVWEESASAA